MSPKSCSWVPRGSDAPFGFNEIVMEVLEEHEGSSNEW